MLWIAPLIHGDSSDEVGFFTAQKLHLRNAGTFGIEVLKKFTGRCIDLINLLAFETEFNEFIRKWMKGEICQNLETVNAQLVLHNNLNITDIVDNLETERFDATKRPDSFKFDIEMHHMYYPPIGFFGNDCYDVIRESDGKRASVRAFQRNPFRGENLKPFIKIEENSKERVERKSTEWSIGENFKFTARIKARKSKSEKKSILIQVEKLNTNMTKSLQDHLNLLFRPAEPISLLVNINTLFEQLPILTNVKDCRLTGEGILKSEDLDRFLTMYPNLNSLSIEPEITGDLTEMSEILKVGRVNLKNCGDFGLSFLKKFPGKHINLENLNITHLDLLEIIKGWVANEAFQNLESIGIVFHRDCETRIDLLVESLETERFDQGIWPPVYRLDTKIIDLYAKEITLEYPECYNVVRRSDGKRASINFP
ncbi:hypothetical protein GCK72_000073 [Caenorhabditis remanei]|uniref:Sdz-33 F-box domain-containing protein n=1 Tax=Caenorhabditis remanei TaxID=31234 RepID=A0A6A5HM81_CAERE|nr:hypothetical protein GCK72_000073 [Caenorhabditis remanei]KAF1768261.1 hypothetical protein GCK72_000073 [Caenorhabditis remanei]